MATVQKFFPIDRIPAELLPPDDKLNYRPDFKDGKFVGLGKPGKDSYLYGFMCDVDENGTIVKARYDLLLKFDGPIQADGHATPSAIMVVLEKRWDGLYLHCIVEFRPLIYDHVAGVQGVEITGFAGGFTEKGKSPRDTALSEVLQEQGVKVRRAKIVRIGWASENRAAAESCPEVYLGIFERQGRSFLKGDEVILKSVRIRVDQFHTGRDALMNNAYAMVVDYLGLVASGNLFVDIWHAIKRQFIALI